MADQEPVTLRVALVGVDSDPEAAVLTAGVAEHEDASGETIIFGRLFSKLGQNGGDDEDTYSISVASGRTTYGGIEHAELSERGVLYLRFTSEAQHELGINSQSVYLDFEVPGEQVAEFVRALRRMGVEIGTS